MSQLALAQQLDDFAQLIRQPATLSRSAHALHTQLDAQRLAIYQQLIAHNSRDFIDRVFPIAQTLVGSDNWLAWQQAFIAQGEASSALYIDISLHFSQFIQAQPVLWQAEFPWLAELLHAEWTELYIERHADSAMPTTATSAYQWSQAFWVLGYTWPVGLWELGVNPTDYQPSGQCVLLWRNSDFFIVKQSISPLLAMLLEYIQGNPSATMADIRHSLTSIIASLNLQPSHAEALFASVLAQLAQAHAMIEQS